MSNDELGEITYNIESTRNHLVIDPNGIGRPGYRVTFTWGKGKQDYVDVLRELYASEYVETLIIERIRLHEGIKSQGVV